MKCLYIPLLLILILSGCSAEWHLSKAVTKDPSILSTKTMIVTDTVVTEPIVVKDTVTISQVDTVEIVKDKFRVKIMRSYDTLIIDGGCDADTIVRTLEVKVPVVEYKERSTFFDKIYKSSFYILIISIIILVLRDVIRRHLG
jgi:hypothetical protein